MAGYISCSSLENSPVNLKQQGIGLIKAEFYKGGKLANFFTGTGFLIEQDIVLTCAHNLLSPKDNLMCSRVIFYLPTLKQGKFEVDLHEDTINCYFSSKNLFYKFNEDILSADDQDFIKLDFAIVKLAQKVATHSLVDLSKVDFARSVKEHEQVILKGFPNKQARHSNENSVYELTTAYGTIKNYNQHNFTYKIESYPGNSGSPVFLSSHSPVGIHISYNKHLDERTATALTKDNIETIYKWIKQINEQEQYRMNSLLQSCRILPTNEKNSPVKDDDRPTRQLISEIEWRNRKRRVEQLEISTQVRTQNPKQAVTNNFQEEDEFTRSFSHKQWGKPDFRKKHKQSKKSDRFNTAILSKEKAPEYQLQTQQRRFLAELILAKSKASKQQYFITVAQTFLTLESLANKFYSCLGIQDSINISGLKDIANQVQQLSQKLNINSNQKSSKEDMRFPQNLIKKPKDCLQKNNYRPT